MIVSGTIYASGTITGNGNSGWLTVPDLFGVSPSSGLRPNLGIRAALLRCVPADLATDETLDIDLNISFDSSGNGDVKIHDFTQVTATNVAENVVLPGGDSAEILVKVMPGAEVGTAANTFTPESVFISPIPPYWKFTHVLGGTTKSMQYTVYGTVWFM